MGDGKKGWSPVERRGGFVGIFLWFSRVFPIWFLKEWRGYFIAMKSR